MSDARKAATGEATAAGPAAQEGELRVPLRHQLAVYATGTFGNTSNNVVSVVMPLWAIELGASPLMIGLVLGSRHLLTSVFSIHGGALMDRLGTRRVLLWFGAVGAITPVLFPFLPYLWAVIVLQMISGMCNGFAWMGAQAQIGQVMRGSATHAGRLSFVLRAGHLSAPLAAGLGWDLGGPWGGFAVVTLWALGIFVASHFLPKPAETGPKRRVPVRELVPRLGDYVDTLRMLAVPAILLVVMVSVLRMSGNGIQGSFYVVYLEGVGFSGTIIGVLLAAGSVLGFASTLSVGPMSRLVSPYWLLVAAVATAIVCISITPLLGGLFVLLLIASALRGGAMGLSQPLMISILSRAADSGSQGRGVALRTTANRLSSLLIPIVMGAVVEFVGLEAGFYVMGGALVAAIVAVAVHVRRSPGFRVRDARGE